VKAILTLLLAGAFCAAAAGRARADYALANIL
jgi:hypothetical protein